MEKEKNILIKEYYILKENILIMKEMEREKNLIMKMDDWNLKENI